MPGLPGAGGLPGHQALHPRWEQHHRPVAAEFFTADVAIRRHSSDGVFDPETGQTVFPEPVEVWTGRVRLQRMTQQAVTRAIGDRQVMIRGVTVSMPVDAPQVLVSDELRVTGFRDLDGGDPHLLNRPLWVHDVYPGSLLFERTLVALDAPVTNR